MSQGVDARNISRALLWFYFLLNPLALAHATSPWAQSWWSAAGGWHRFGSGTKANITRGVDLQRAGDSSSASTARRFTKDWHGGGEVKQ